MEPLLTALSFFLPVCLFLLCGALALGLVGFFLFRTATRTKIAPPIGRETFLAQAGETLLPWSQDAFEDLAAHWRGNWTAVGVRGYFQGVVKSLRQPEAGGWLAFHVERPDAQEAHVTMRTSEKQLVLDLRLEKVAPPTGEADVTLDGQPFGHIRLPECALLDVDGTPVGQYRRRYSGLRARRYYGAVMIGERTIAELTDVWMRLPAQFKGRFYRSFTPLPEPWPALRDLPPDLTPTEEDWLLTVLALELFFDSNWVRDTW